MNNEVWDYVAKLYERNFGVSRKTLDLVAVDPILKMCVEGYSNRRIANSLFRSDVKYVEKSLVEFMDFYGWDYDMDISPWAVYNRSNDDYNNFYQEMITSSPYVSDSNIKISFYLCRRYKTIRKEIKERYEDKIT